LRLLRKGFRSLDDVPVVPAFDTRATEEDGGTMTIDETTYERIKHLLSDGDWHREDELARVSSYPREWVRELELAREAEIERDADDRYVLRLLTAA
jgi:hypothetical protein